MRDQHDDHAIDTAWRIHGTLVDWTGKVDSKASFTVGVESAAVAGIITLSASGRALAHLRGWSHALYWLGVGLLVLGELSALYVVRPRLRNRAVKAEVPHNFIFFGHLRHWDANQLAAELMEANPLPVLATQLVNMSKIAWLKHRLVQYSITLAVVGLAAVALAGYVGSVSGSNRPTSSISNQVKPTTP